MAAKILVVEDEASISMLMRDDLVLEGYEVMMARDGEEGLRLSTQFSPDLVVLDVMLPKKSGFEVCRQLKAQRKDLPVILLTAKGQESDKVTGFEMGADDYLTKPFSMLELLARIKVALRHRNQFTEGQRMSAIVMTDVAGYTQLAAAVPQAALMELMKRHHGQLAEAAKQFRGRVANTVADSSALLFDSVTDAVDAALAVQRLHRTLQDGKPLPLHVGVHVGEVTIGRKDHELYGDAVNVAARVAKLSQDGSVCVSEAVKLMLPRPRTDWVDLGLQELKGVDQPVRIFQLTI